MAHCIELRLSTFAHHRDGCGSCVGMQAGIIPATPCTHRPGKPCRRMRLHRHRQCGEDPSVDLDPGQPCGVERAAWLDSGITEASSVHTQTPSGSTVQESSRGSFQGAL